jgi:hypothetical protein
MFDPVWHREPIIDPDDRQLVGHVEEAIGVPPWQPIQAAQQQLQHRVSWVAGGIPWTTCAIAVTADWLLVPVGTQLLTGGREPIERCPRCEHAIVDVVATDATRALASSPRVIEGSVADA